MFFALLVLISAAVVVLDQITKAITVANIALFEEIPFLPGLVDLPYVRNNGAAFSSFRGMQWMFALVFVIFTLLILWEYFKKPMGFNKFERICIAAVYGGGLGNMIDRLRMGYVVDMIETTFMEFPVFNVADIFITCGCVLLLVSLVFFNKEFWKEEKK